MRRAVSCGRGHGVEGGNGGGEGCGVTDVVTWLDGADDQLLGGACCGHRIVWDRVPGNCGGGVGFCCGLWSGVGCSVGGEGSWGVMAVVAKRH